MQDSTPTRLPASFDTPVKVVFTDVDDTLTWEGKLPPETFLALERLRRSGIKVVPVTGASAGWCDCIVRTWPVESVIGENGSFWMQRNASGHVIRTFRETESRRNDNNRRLKALGSEVMHRFPEIGYTQDQPFRLTDMAFDIAQQAQVPLDVAHAATEWLKAQTEVSARLSSIHLNVWIGDYNKADTALAWLNQHHPELSAEHCAFIGDSPNDEAMFEHFPRSIGVANIQRFLAHMQHQPRYITENTGGYGFVELSECLLKGLTEDTTL
ncbi:HAD-IIB family hydrolase [Mangrovitalea sediminis]|uniref:HAD-IIB family hydrolase n=1 Tax=Mangrovitalea sediminis TaxID=1982043 RepID=UPI000BE5DF89|nr:HAD-IIB family hydrolase [Mangrovitalea sediminis]